jgi:hypothetical protein
MLSIRVVKVLEISPIAPKLCPRRGFTGWGEVGREPGKLDKG